MRSSRLGDIVEAIRGITFPASELVANPAPGLIACLTTSAVHEPLRWSTARYIPTDYLASDSQILRQGDILMSTANSKPNVGTSARVESPPFEATFGAFVTAIRPGSDVDSAYLGYWFRSSYFLSAANSLASQTTNIANLRVSDLMATHIPLPRLDDQRRIATELGDKLAGVASASSIAAIRRQGTRHLRDATLRSAFESGGASRWPRTRLGEICEFVSDGTHQPPLFAADGVPFLFVRNIVGGRIDLETDRHVSLETYEELTRRRRPARGDVLYSAVGSFGVAVVVETDRPFTFQRHIAHLRLRTDIASPDFVAAYINSPAGVRQSESVAMGGAQRTVTLGALASFDLPLPAIEDQRRVAAELRERLAVIDDIEASIRAEREAMEALPAALLRRAFDGLAA